MTPAQGARPSGEARESAFWRMVLRLFINGAPTRFMRFIRQHNPAVTFEDFVIIGRRTGQERRLLLGLFDVDGTWYVGHPNGTSQWIRNLEAAGECIVTRRDGVATRVTAVEVTDPEERELVISATGRQPTPAGQVYRGARRHIRAVGRYFRLEPASVRSDDAAAPSVAR